MKNKKGVEINITTIIILVLAILVLVILALYFTGGMKSLWDQIRGTGSIYNSNDKASAKALCETRDQASFCSQAIQLYNSKTGKSDSYYCWGTMIGASLRDENGKVVPGFEKSAGTGKIEDDGKYGGPSPTGCSGYISSA